MTKEEFIKALRSAKKVYAYVKYSDDDGTYVKISKRDLLGIMAGMDDCEGVTFNASVTNGSVWIN